MRKVYKLKDPMERFFNHIEVSGSGCWEWTGYVHHRTGYALFKVRDTYFLIHRFSYLVFRGKIPEGLEIDHLCRNRKCANPDHLEAVTRLENNRRAPDVVSTINAKMTHCKYGHEFTGTDKRGQRTCRICRAAIDKRHYIKRMLQNA